MREKQGWGKQQNLAKFNFNSMKNKINLLQARRNMKVKNFIGFLSSSKDKLPIEAKLLSKTHNKRRDCNTDTPVLKSCTIRAREKYIHAKKTARRMRNKCLSI